MGVETELFGLKNRWDGKEFRVIERADGSIAVLAGEKVLVDSGVTPVTAVPSDQGPRFQGLGIADVGLSMILPASVLAAPVAVTGVTTEQILHQFVVPKECHGLTTRLAFAMLASMTNNANAKTFRIRIGSAVGASTIIAQSAPANASTLSVPRFQLKNRNSKSAQVSPFTLSLAAGTSSTPPSTFTIDLTVDQTVFVTVQLASAGDTATLEDFEMAFGG